MSLTIFRTKRAAGIELAGSQYLDRYGHFIKRECDLHTLRVTFADVDIVELSADEYGRLTTAELDDVKNAGVSVSIVDNRDNGESAT